MSQSATTIFRNGSTTYFTASLFFPQQIKERVFTLYAFVRVVDDFVDQVPQDSTQFYDFWTEYTLARENQPTDNTIIHDFIALQQQVGIRDEWVDAFFLAMEADLYKKRYFSLSELELYMYGSAEVIGLMLIQCFGLSHQCQAAARQLGKAMQYANFLRDLAEDLELGRQYIPQEVLAEYGLQSLEKRETDKKSAAFTQLYQAECARYFVWNKKAEKGFCYLPLQLRVPVSAASAMYAWTVSEIQKNPMLVYSRKLKPSKKRVVSEVVKGWIHQLVTTPWW